MKNILVFLTAAFLMSWTPMNSYSHAIAERDRSEAGFSDITGKQWKLIEVYVYGENTQFNRDSFLNDVMNTPLSEGQEITLYRYLPDMFTLTFDRQNRLSGTGAPNAYSAPFTLGDDQTISISPMVSTMMAPLFQQGYLGEHEYFAFLQSAQKWGLVNGNLELYSKMEDGREIRLVFGL